VLAAAAAAGCSSKSPTNVPAGSPGVHAPPGTKAQGQNGLTKERRDRLLQQ
jgi:hypothetical protein